MTPLRLVLVTQRFWPLMGRSSRVMANLASELTSRNAEVTLLTARWHRRWPTEVRFRDVPVLRLAKPPGRDAGRSVRPLARWLRSNRDGYDLVCVSQLKHEACAVFRAVAGEVPVVLRAETAGRLGDCLGQLDSGAGRRIKAECMKADALVGPSRMIERELIAAGYPRDRVYYLPNGVPIAPERTKATRAAGRAALASISSTLRMPERAPLAVAIGRLDGSKGLGYLVAAWQRVVAARPDARLWLVGDGPHRRKLENQIVDLDLVGRVFVPGEFDSVDVLLAAADLFLSPASEEGPSLATAEAMGAGLPVVATDLPGNRELMADGEHGLLVPDRDPQAVAAAVLRLLGEPGLAAMFGAAARDRAARWFPLDRMVDAHVELFENLARPRSVQVRR